MTESERSSDHRIARYGKTTAKEGKGDELGRILIEAADLNQTIEGCLQYDVYQSAFDPETIWVTELWADQAAIDRSLGDPRVKELIDRARPLIDDLEVIALVPLGGVSDRLELAEQRRPTPATGAATWTRANVDDLDDLAPAHGFTTHEARFPSGYLNAAATGLAHIRIKPGERLPFGHDHATVEETYYVTAGSGRMKLGDDVIEVSAGDFLRIGPKVMHSAEAGPDGLDYIAFGPPEPRDAGGRFEPGWWND